MSNRRVALVTGGATGMGKACAIKLAENGCSIALNFRTKKTEADAVLQELSGNGHKLFQADISRPDEVKTLVQSVINELKGIDVLVNAAGVFAEHDITSLNYDNWVKSWSYNLGANLIGPVNLAFCVAQQMIKQGRGKIINITSRGAFRGEPDAPAYGASKAGLNSASQSLAKALAPHGISVYAVAPGWVDTPLASPYLESSAGPQIKEQSPLGRVGQPSEIGNLVNFLAGEETEYLTGAIIDANGASYLRN